MSMCIDAAIKQMKCVLPYFEKYREKDFTKKYEARKKCCT